MSQYTKEQLDYICRTAARQFAKDNESVIQAVMKCSSFHTNVYVRTYRAGAANCTVDVPENYTFVTATAILCPTLYSQACTLLALFQMTAHTVTASSP